MTWQELFNDIFALYMSGAAEMFNEKEIRYKDEYWGRKMTIEFCGGPKGNVMVREYYQGTNNIRCINRYKNGVKHGKQQSYLLKGIKWREECYKNGKKHGRDWCFDTDGRLIFEARYENGIMVL